MEAHAQRPLPFDQAEASYAERRNLLGLALMRSECDLYLAQFCLWVYNTTQGGSCGVLKKSYEQLAARPWGLCCSRSKARSTVLRAGRLGLVETVEERYCDFGQQPNAYRIDWQGVKRIVHGGRPGVSTEHPGVSTEHPGVSTEHPGVSTEHPGVSTEHPGVSTEHPFKEETPVRSPFYSGPGPEAGPNPRMDSERTEADRRHVARILADSPILAEAGLRPIAPLEASGLVHGVWAAIQVRHLREPVRLVEWFRRQLSTARPVTGATEADLLLVLAAALYSTSLAEGEVKKSREAVFVATVHRRIWLRALPFVPQARRILDDGIERFGVAWAGLGDGEGVGECEACAVSGGAADAGRCLGDSSV